VRVLIVTPSFPPNVGGPASYSWELLSRWPPKVSTTVASFGSPISSKIDPRIILISTSGGVFVRQLRLFWACLIKGKDVDVFFLQEPAVVGLTALITARILGKKVVTKYFGDPVWEDGQRHLVEKRSLPEFLSDWRSTLNFQSKMTNFVLKHSDLIIVPTDFLLGILLKHYNLDKNYVVNLYSPVDLVTSVPLIKNKGFSWNRHVATLSKYFSNISKS